MKILVRATNWIGDAVMSLPALRAIRSAFPDSELTVLARPWVADLYEQEQSIDSVIRLENNWKAIRLLRRERFDLAILFPNSFASAAILFLADIPHRVGYARDARSVLLTDAVAVPRQNEVPRHERFYYLELLRRAHLIESIDVPDLNGFGFSRGAGERLFAERGIRMPVAGVSPGAAYGSAKRWIPERFAEAARRLAEGGSVVVFGSEAERTLCGQVADACGGHNLAGATRLREFIDMTAACQIFLTNDSGAMHIASALGVPSVTVFGPTDETATGPTGPNAAIVREPVECAPCKLRECPIDHRCMTRVTVDQVVEAAGVKIRGCPKQ